jgi:Tat protein secretion system quality control protein TatD with DNase activity
MLIETHAHLDYPDFAADFDEVLRRATEAGVARIIEATADRLKIRSKDSSLISITTVKPPAAADAIALDEANRAAG